MTASIRISTDKGSTQYGGETLEECWEAIGLAMNAVAAARVAAWSKTRSNQYRGVVPNVLQWGDHMEFRDGDSVTFVDYDSDNYRTDMAVPFEVLLLPPEELTEWAIAERAEAVARHDRIVLEAERAKRALQLAESRRREETAAKARRGARALELLEEARQLRPGCDPAILLDDILDRIEKAL
jgi:hypothetical protein